MNGLLTSSGLSRWCKYQLKVPSVPFPSTGMTGRENWMIQTATTSLARYKVLGVLGTVLLVLDVSDNSTCVVKVLTKSSLPSVPLTPCIVPVDVPHMVRLIRYHETEDSIFLVLQHAVGGKLWNYVSSYLHRGSDGMTGPDPCAVYAEGPGILDEANIYAGKKLLRAKCQNLVDSVRQTVLDQDPNQDLEKGDASVVDCSPSYVDLFTDYVACTSNEGRVSLAECRYVASKKSSNSHRFDTEQQQLIEADADFLGTPKENGVPFGRDNDEHNSWCDLDKVEAEELISKAQRLIEHVDETLRESDKVNHLMGKDVSNVALAVDNQSPITAQPVGFGSRPLPSPSRVVTRRLSDASHWRLLHRQASDDAFASPVHDGHLSGWRSSTSSLDLQRGSRMRHFSAVFQHLDEMSGPSPGLPESCIRVWAAEIVKALSALHGSGIICKDLKPDNILLGERGHILLSYFGRWPLVEAVIDPIAKQMLYAAPEVGGITEVTPACDWWSLGVLLFELFTGKTFVCLHPGGLTSHSQLHLPCKLSEEAESLLRGLLCYSPSERLGNGPNGLDNIKGHPFFEDVDWNTLAT